MNPKLERVAIGSMSFPLGVYPVEPMEPLPGYLMQFEPADGDDGSGDWEEWPDRYVFDAVITCERLEALVTMLIQAMPPRAYPILDVMGHDAYREIDPYISYELVGTDRMTDALRRYRSFFLEDGLVGFGAMCDDPFAYFFVDEHKIVTVRVEPDSKERIEKIFGAFDLTPVAEPAGADAAAHEHRTVLRTPPDDPDLQGVDEIVERLRDDWRLTLNIDPESNVDDAGRALGSTGWRVLIRAMYEDRPQWKYAEALMRASCLRQAEELALELVLGPVDRPRDRTPQGEEPPSDALIVSADRLSPEQFKAELERATRDAKPGRGKPLIRWLE
ncbi:MAG: hypothetical protein AAGB51_12490 [Planctomycetota bacterium]